MDLFFAAASVMDDVTVVETVVKYPDQGAEVLRLSVRCGAGDLVWSSDPMKSVMRLRDAAKASAGKNRVRMVTP